MSNLYRQVTLKKGDAQTITWALISLAKLNKTLKLKKEDGTWDEGWVVTEVNDAIIEEDYLDILERQHKHQREASDI